MMVKISKIILLILEISWESSIICSDRSNNSILYTFSLSLNSIPGDVTTKRGAFGPRFFGPRF